MAERKVPSSVSFTPRQTAAINHEAKRLGVSFADALRRVIDGWIDAKPGLGHKLYEGGQTR